MLHVCSLSRLEETVKRTGARHLVTLINADTPVQRPSTILRDNHLFLSFNDIVTPLDGFTLPGEADVTRLVRFVTEWDGKAPMVIHCWAGISRSTAAAYITACARHPDHSEQDFAEKLRAASPSATPNARLVALADELLGREGRMTDAIQSIGRGEDAFEGSPFEMPLRIAPT